jgi:Cu/Ag efflux pump CusA
MLPLVVAFALAPRLGSEFMPKLDEGNIWLTIALPTSASGNHQAGGAADARQADGLSGSGAHHQPGRLPG